MTEFIPLGSIISTSYGTGPYKVIGRSSSACTCAKYLDRINGNETQSHPHYHYRLKSTDPKDRTDYYLNGYACANGRYQSVWNDYYIIVHELGIEKDETQKVIEQLTLF